jgi:hypothetical protein
MKTRIAVALAIGTLGLILAGNGLAATPPMANSPPDGTQVVAGSEITFVGTATATATPPAIYFYISKDNATDSNGRLTHAFAVVTGGTPTSTPGQFQGVADSSDFWPDVPGDYYWQVNQDCGSPPAPVDCTAWSDPVKLTITPRPASSVSVSNPPNTHFTRHPPHKTQKRKVVFAFTSDFAGATFQCLYAQGWSKCTSPHTFRHLKPGRFRFLVKAIVNGVEDPTPASWLFRVLP